MRRHLGFQSILISLVSAAALPAIAQPQSDDRDSQLERRPSNDLVNRQTKLESAFAKMLSGATLEGSYTSTGPGSDPAKISSDKYTLGEVRKVSDHVWLIPARIQYGEHDVTLPINVPIYWAGDTPVIVVDNLRLPPFGTVSARVMFFGGHYAGYWRHGEHGGHLFGVVQPAEKEPVSQPADRSQPAASPDLPADQQENQ